MEDLAFTSKEVLTLIGLLIVFILAVIYSARYFIAKKSRENLQEKYKGKLPASPLVGRNKYQEVDIFNYRSPILLFGFVVSLLLAIGALGLISYKKEVVIPDDALEMEEDFDISPPRSTGPPPPPPPPPPPSVIKEVPEEEFIEEEEIEFVDQSIDISTEVVAPVIKPKKVKAEVPPPPPPPPPPPEPEVEEIFQIVEEMPRFPGCENEPDEEVRKECATQKMLEFIYEHITYPPIARENGVEGTVVIRFIVDKDGLVKEPTVLRDIGALCGEEALRVVKLMNNMPEKWIPGKQRGKPVKVYFNLPVKFKLVRD